MKIVRHILVTVISLAVILGVPYFTSDHFKRLVSGSTDDVASASVKIDQPSGEYCVFINSASHLDKEALDLWISYFRDGNTDVITLFEDIECSVAEGDPTGLAMAQSYQSGLAQNQMTIKEEDPTLMLSKADNGKFDIMIMSAELADALKADTACERSETILLRVKGE